MATSRPMVRLCVNTYGFSSTDVTFTGLQEKVIEKLVALVQLDIPREEEESIREFVEGLYAHAQSYGKTGCYDFVGDVLVSLYCWEEKDAYGG